MGAIDHGRQIILWSSMGAGAIVPVWQALWVVQNSVSTILVLNQLDLTEGFNARLVTKFLLNNWVSRSSNKALT
jgi:hypothetical protein